jgi:hypothetical protein
MIEVPAVPIVTKRYLAHATPFLHCRHNPQGASFFGLLTSLGLAESPDKRFDKATVIIDVDNMYLF